MESEDMKPYLKDKCCVRLIQCFLNPDLHMIRDEEDVTEQKTPGHSIDSIYQLFTPGNAYTEDKSMYMHA